MKGKNVMKRILSMILSVILLISINTITTFATDPVFTIAVESRTASPGETILVEINITNNPGISTISDLRVDLGSGLKLYYPAGKEGYAANANTWPFIAGNRSPADGEGMIPIMGRPTDSNIGDSHIVLSFLDTSEPFDSVENGRLVALRLIVDSSIDGGVDDFSINITVFGVGNIAGNTIPATITNGEVTVITPPSITTTTLASGVVGNDYIGTLSATGTAPIVWRITDGFLPEGLTLSDEGIISGKPVATGTYNFTVEASNGIVPSAVKQLSIIINLPVLDHIEVTTPPIKTAYFVGESLNLTGMVVTAYYNDGSSKVVTGYTTNPIGGTALNTAGQQTVTVSYIEGGVAKTANFVVSLNKPILTGTVLVSGDAVYGQTLTAVTTSLSSDPAVSLGAPSYQWNRGDEPIDGAESVTYDLVQEDIGQTITVMVTVDNCEGSVTSAPTLAVRKADGPANPPMISIYTGDGTTFTYTAPLLPNGQYKKDDGDWQDNNVFSGIIPLSTHTFSARVKKTDTHNAGTPGHIEIEFIKLDDRDVPPIAYDVSGDFPDKIVTIVMITGAEYRFEGETSIQAYSPKNTYTSEIAEDVTLYIRLAETATHNPSLATSITINTDNLPQDAPPAFTLTYESVNDTRYTVTIPLTEGAEYSFDGLIWGDVNTKTDCMPGQTITGYKRMAAYPGYNASPSTFNSVELPLLQVMAPTSLPDGGTFVSSQIVNLLCETVDAMIYYTLDGTMPTADSLLYTEAFTLTSTTTVRAIAIKPGIADSAVLTATFTRSSGSSSTPRPAPTVIDPVETPKIEWGSFTAFINGYPDHTFRGQNTITREEFVNILFKIKNPDVLPEADTNSPSFSDVMPGRWSYNAIEWAKGAGITEADSGDFRPSDPITRAEVAAMLVKLEAWTEAAENVFSDIEEHPNHDDILKAVKAGIFIGYPDNTFKPDDGIIRYELVAAMVRYLLGDEPEDSVWKDIVLPFTDVPSDHWAYKYAAMAIAGYEVVTKEENS